MPAAHSPVAAAAAATTPPAAEQNEVRAALCMLSAIASVLPHVGVEPEKSHLANLRGPILRPRHIFLIIVADKELASTLLPSQWGELARLTRDAEGRRVSQAMYARRMKRLLGREILRILAPYRGVACT